MAGQARAVLKQAPSASSTVPLHRLALGIAAALAASFIASRLQKRRKAASLPPPLRDAAAPSENSSIADQFLLSVEPTKATQEVVLEKEARVTLVEAMEKYDLVEQGMALKDMNGSCAMDSNEDCRNNLEKQAFEGNARHAEDYRGGDVEFQEEKAAEDVSGNLKETENSDKDQETVKDKQGECPESSELENQAVIQSDSLQDSRSDTEKQGFEGKVRHAEDNRGGDNELQTEKAAEDVSCDWDQDTVEDKQEEFPESSELGNQAVIHSNSIQDSRSDMEKQAFEGIARHAEDNSGGDNELQTEKAAEDVSYDWENFIDTENSDKDQGTVEHKQEKFPESSELENQAVIQSDSIQDSRSDMEKQAFEGKARHAEDDRGGDNELQIEKAAEDVSRNPENFIEIDNSDKDQDTVEDKQEEFPESSELENQPVIQLDSIQDSSISSKEPFLLEAPSPSQLQDKMVSPLSIEDQALQVIMQKVGISKDNESDLEQEIVMTGGVAKYGPLEVPKEIVKLYHTQQSPSGLHSNCFPDARIDDSQQNHSEIDDISHESSTENITDLEVMQHFNEVKEICVDRDEKGGDVKQMNLENQTFSDVQKLESYDQYLNLVSCSAENIYKKEVDAERSNLGGSVSDVENLECGIIEKYVTEDLIPCTAQNSLHENVPDLKREMDDDQTSLAENEVHESSAGPIDVQNSHHMNDMLESQNIQNAIQMSVCHSENGYSDLSSPISPPLSCNLENAMLAQNDSVNFLTSTMRAGSNMEVEAEEVDAKNGKADSEPEVKQSLLGMEEDSNVEQDLKIETQKESRNSLEVEKRVRSNNQFGNLKTRDFNLELGKFKDEKLLTSEVGKELEDFVMSKEKTIYSDTMKEGKSKSELGKPRDGEVISSGWGKELHAFVMPKEITNYSDIMKAEKLVPEPSIYGKEPMQITEHSSSSTIMSFRAHSRLHGKAFLPVEVSVMGLLICLMSIILWYLKK